ncbi:MAG: hypothetical protein DRQ51_09995 [Gammaproteobacteria bacterium]|nr:MAG: hypothetical protein DRQ51_09995 [Gammaproteobacteria bacterium]
MKLFNQQLILTIFALMLISCGSGEDDNSSLIKSPASNSSATNSISGKAIDGYLSGSTVCLDLDDDGVCSSDSEPTNKTDNTGSYTLTLSTNHKAHSNFNKSSVIVYGGTDIDSNQSFAGKLKAYNNGNSTIHITPTTTLIDSMALPYADAKAKIADTFGIDEATIESDPIATNNATLFAKAVAVQRAVDLLVNADDSTDSNSTKANKIMTAIAAGLKSKTGSQSIDTIINSIDKTGLNSKTQNALKLAAQLAIATKDTYKDVTDRSDYAKISDTYFQDAKQVIIDNGLTEQITDAEIKAFEERVQQKEHSDNIKATIKGTVKDSDGKAYANRTVFLRDNVAIGNGNGGFYTTQTDDSGNYSFLIFSKGNYTLWLKLITDEQQTAPSPGGKNIVFNDTAEITTAGSVTTMDFVVKKPTQSVGTCPETEAKAIFCGKVFADKNGNNEFDTGEQVFKNADVYVQDLDNGGFYGPTTDENGDYNFAAYEVGKFKIWINAHVSYQSNVVLPVESDKSHYPFY